MDDRKSDTDESDAEQTRGVTSVLRRVLPIGAAFAFGYLFGKRSEGTPAVDEMGMKPSEIEVPDAVEKALERENEQKERGEQDEQESQTERDSKAEQAESNRDESASEVTAFSAPVTHGMPMFGFGTYELEDYDQCVESVKTAIETGYRHIDTAEGYDNESAVGDAIAESDVSRDELFVATKVSPENLDFDHVLTSAEESLERLGLDYVDLLYVHWPTGEYEATDTLEAFAELREEGLIREIGVSNFTVELLQEAVETAEEPIFANQVEMHPMLQQNDLREFCAQDDVDVELVAYSPIARGDVADIPELRAVAEKHDATPTQVSLAWCREKGVTTIPKATGREHIQENWRSLGVELDEEDIEKIDAIDREERLVDPDRAPWN